MSPASRVLRPIVALTIALWLTPAAASPTHAQGAASPPASVLPTASVVPAASFAPPLRWVRATLPDAPEGVELMDVVAGGPGFIAVGGGFHGGQEDPVAEIWTSEDGLDWSRVPLEGDAAVGQIRSIVPTPDGFVAVGGRCCPDQALTWRSADGVAWELMPPTGRQAQAAMLDVAPLSGGVVVSVGCEAVMECGGGLAWRSEDGGRTWGDAVPLDWLPLALASAAGGLVAVGTDDPYGGGPVGAVSADGIAWDRTDLPVTRGSLVGILGYPDGAIALGYATIKDGGPPYSLVGGTDGLAWQVLESGGIRHASFDDGVWLGGTPTSGTGGLLVVGTDQATATRPGSWWSTDGTTWQPVRYPRAEGLVHAVAAGVAGTVVSVGIAELGGAWVAAAWVATTDPGR